MSDDCEYVSNPRLRVLAEELRILNDILVKKNLPDRIRLFQLRDFAQASKHITGVSLPVLRLVGEDSDNPRWTTTIDGKSIGEFSTPTQATEAYKRAHVERFGLDSQYHPDRPIDESHLYDGGELPTGVQITTEGRYKVQININRVQTYLGIFNTIEEASEVYRNAKAKSHRPTLATAERLPSGAQKADSGKYRARISGKHVGTFNAAEDAFETYQHAKSGVVIDTITAAARVANIAAAKEERERKEVEKTAAKEARAAAKAEAKPKLEAEVAKRILQRNAAKARAGRSAKTAAERQARAERYGNVTLPTGVRMSPAGKFQARIKTGKGDNKVETHLGVFDTPEEAHDAYKRAHAEHHGKASPYYENMKEAA